MRLISPNPALCQRGPILQEIRALLIDAVLQFRSGIARQNPLGLLVHSDTRLTDGAQHARWLEHALDILHE